MQNSAITKQIEDSGLTEPLPGLITGDSTMIDYRLLNTRLLMEIGADVKLTPAELHSLARVAHRERRLRDHLARLAELAREDRNVIQFRKRGE